MKKVEAYTLVYGETFLDLFSKTAKSIAFPMNSHEHVTWNIFTDFFAFDFIRETVNRILPREKVKLFPVSALKRTNERALSGLLWQIESCLRTESSLLMLPPDTIWGKGSIENLLQLNDEKKNVAVAHPRVLPTITDEFEYFNTDNKRLTTLAFKNAHQSWTDAERGHAKQNTFRGGIEWEKIAGKTIVTHYLPTVYLANLNQRDYDFFDTAPYYFYYDSVWPEKLVQEDRLFYMGSNDLVFNCEVTLPQGRIPEVVPGEPKRDFHNKHFHNKVFSNFRVVFNE